MANSLRSQVGEPSGGDVPPEALVDGTGAAVVSAVEVGMVRVATGEGVGGAEAGATGRRA